MTGRLASTFITAAGKPQKIFTVPNGKVFSGKIVLFNKTGESRTLQVKHGQAIGAPVASFPFSNAQKLTSVDANDRPNGQLGYVLGNGNAVPLTNSAGAYDYDLSTPEAPVRGGQSPQHQNPHCWPRTSAAWNTANRLVGSDGNQLFRYAGLVDPWNLGTYGTIIGGGGTANIEYNTGAGWDQYAIAASGSNGYLCFVTNAGTSGSVSMSADTLTNLGMPVNGGSWSGSYLRCHVTANGMFFFQYPGSSGDNYMNLCVAAAANIGTASGWSAVFTNLYAYSRITYHEKVFYAAGYYWILIPQNGTYAKWIRIPEADIFTYGGDTTEHVFDSSPGLNQYGQNWYSYPHSFNQLDDGSIVWFSSNGWWRLDPVANTIEAWVSDVGSQLLPVNFANYGASKLSPVNIGTIFHTVPATGAADPDNERIAYTSSGAYEFVDDDTWSLQDVTDDSGWIDYDLSLTNKAEVEYAGRMLSASDEIWVRSTGAGLTVSIEGFLLDAAA